MSAAKPAVKKVVLAYSGGLDTSIWRRGRDLYR
jgi:PP-loop superfamily ATP-utilizing enzyme